MRIPFVDETFTLLKSQKKGGWTYILIPLDKPLTKVRFGVRKVSGYIDDYELKDFAMWSMKQGHFVSVKADIRKAIKKEEGDTVRLVIYLDEELPDIVDDDFIVCLKDDPECYKAFMAYPEKKRKLITAWVFTPATEEGKVQRIGEAMDRIAAGFDKW